MKVTHPKRESGHKIVLIIGAGFAGLNAAKTLARRAGVHVLLIDQKNHHLFQPLLYQVATAGLNVADIAVPIRSQFARVPNVEVHQGAVGAVDLQNNTVISEDRQIEFEFDYLILACGAQHSYFAHPEWEDFAPGLKTLEQATEIRRRILRAFEHAENELDEEKQKALLNFVVVGGGPTGVELAGAIADISRTVLVHDFHRINPAAARVFILEMGPRLLPAFKEELSNYTAKALGQLGVEVRTCTRVDNINALGVQAGQEWIATQSVFWAAGVQASAMRVEPAPDKDKAGRIHVKPDLSLPGNPNAFVVGDMAAVEMEAGKFVPGLAPAAIQEGRHAANMILQDMRQKPRQAFRYVDKGQMATIGKNRAVAQTGKLEITGRLAWFAWLFVHLIYLVGFKNKYFVLFQWAWSYLFSKRGARLITDREWKLKN